MEFETNMSYRGEGMNGGMQIRQFVMIYQSNPPLNFALNPKSGCKYFNCMQSPNPGPQNG